MKEIKKVIIEAVQDSIDLTDNQVSISVLNTLLDQQLPEQLALYGVSHRRELLKGFMKHIEKDGAISFRDYNFTIRNFEEDNKTLL
jgi:hypothetical protein